MAVNVRIRNGMEPDMGSGGASEGDIRGYLSDMVEGEGVVDKLNGHLLVHEAGSPGMTVVVDEGVAYIPNDSFDETDSDQVRIWEAVVSGSTGSRTLAIGSNSSGSTRIDLIVLTLDPGEPPDSTASNIAVLAVEAGTPGAGVPATPANSLVLAQVTVVNGETTINDNEIEDVRVQVKFSDRFVPEIRTVYPASATSFTPNADVTDVYEIDQLAHNTTINKPTGTPHNGQIIEFKIRDAGVSKTIAWNADYRLFSTFLPDATVAGDWVRTIAEYNAADDKWDVLGSALET